MRVNILRPLDSHIRCFSDMFVCGLTMSSTVTAAIALILEETVLWSSGLEGGNSKSGFIPCDCETQHIYFSYVKAIAIISINF